MVSQGASPTPTLRAGDRVVVTGATGFIGSAIVRALLARGVQVVAVYQPNAVRLPLDGLDAEEVEIELSDEAGLNATIRGARTVFHVSPDYRAKAHDPRSFQSQNVSDTRRVLSAARLAGCERVVYTSSVATLGLEGCTLDDPATENSIPRIDQLVGLYKQSKYVAEHEVFREAASGMPIVLVMPTTSLGQFDFTPTPSGAIVLGYLNGRSGNWFDTSLNIVDVDDLASGYLLAAERGTPGRSYILGGENVSNRQLFELLERLTGVRAKGFRVPRRAALAVAGMSELVEGRILRREPSIPIEGVRLAATPLIFSSARAQEELGYAPHPASYAVARAARWFAENGYVAPRQLKQIHWSDESA